MSTPMPPRSLAEALWKHIQAKVTNKNCECCGNGSWTLLSDATDLDNYFNFTSAQPNIFGEHKSFPFACIACTNCHHVRWFAVAPFIRSLEKK